MNFPLSNRPVPETTPRRFPAFSHQNFRIFWTGNVVSLVGSLAQDTARGWLVRSLTANTFTIGAVAACATLPILFFALFAGVVADRVDRRRALMITNGLAMVLALVLAALTYWNFITVPQVAVLAVLAGTVNAFDIPIRQSFNLEMVGREDLPNAIALNSTAFNSARVAGPAVGGLLIQFLGLAGCFALNAISFLALIFGLSRMDIQSQKSEKVAPRWSELREGFDFVRSHPVLRPTVSLVAATSLFAMSFGPMLPVFAKDIFNTGAGGFALLMTANGAGALFAAATLAVKGTMRYKGKRLLLGAFLFCGFVAAFALSPNLPLACLFLILAGWALLTFLMTANTLVQTTAPDEIGGRVFALYSMALLGTAPLGALWIGGLAKVFGPREAVALSCGLAASWALATFVFNRALWKEK